MGVSRSKMEIGGILGQLNKFTPGPGKYELGSTISDLKWSFR